MEVFGKSFHVKDTFDNIVTIPDCFVLGKNKIGHGHGEAKLYMGSKDVVRDFFGGTGFKADCFLLKKDLVAYLEALKNEYLHPTQEYIGKEKLPSLWIERMQYVKSLDDVITFRITEQYQIEGPRGYVNSDDIGYKLLRELSLPLISYMSAMQLVDNNGKVSYYWKLFADFDAISEKSQALVYTYGKKGEQQTVRVDTTKEKKEYEVSRARIGQGKYREALLEDCPFCPITMLNEESLLIASHIKPWAVSDDKEKIDYKNGFMLSPLYDKLFDKGFITFTDDKRMIVSNWLSVKNQERLRLKNEERFPHLPIDDKRAFYLRFHRESVFKG